MSGIEVVFVNLATGCFFGFLCCLFFMTWFLRQQVDDELRPLVRRAIWVETIFYFRDFTRERSSCWYLVYLAATGMLAVVLGVFVVNIFFQVSGMQPFIKYLLGSAAVMALLFVFSFVYRMSQKDYHLHDPSIANDEK